MDFACPSRQLIIELDGGQHADADYGDGKRDAWLRSNGYRVLRFWNNDVLRDTEAVLSEILRHLSD